MSKLIVSSAEIDGERTFLWSQLIALAEKKSWFLSTCRTNRNCQILWSGWACAENTLKHMFIARSHMSNIFEPDLCGSRGLGSKLNNRNLHNSLTNQPEKQTDSLETIILPTEEKNSLNWIWNSI